MFDWLKRLFGNASRSEILMAQPPREIFPWPKGVVIIAVDELVIGLPMALFDKGRPMSEFMFGSNNMEVNLDPKGEIFLIRLQPGMSVSLAKSCDAFIVSDEKTYKRFKIREPE